jgi:DNA-binding beta-propeller fold protein YncE
VTVLAGDLGDFPTGVTTDGAYIWTVNAGPPATVSRVNPANGTAQTFTISTTHEARGITFDGNNLWVSLLDSTLRKLDGNGNVLQTVPTGNGPLHPVFDGKNLWVPNTVSHSVTVIAAATGSVLATLTGNGLSSPAVAAFDGERVLVTNDDPGQGVSLWKSADLSPLGFSLTEGNEMLYGACSDGINFWVVITGSQGAIARF